MSAPDPEVAELSSVKFPKVTPPATPVVFDQKVIGPLEVLISLGLPLTPALPVIRPPDLTRVPDAPAVMFPSRATVVPASMRTDVALIAPEPVLTLPLRLLIVTSPAAVKVVVVLLIAPLVNSSIFPDVV